MDSTEPGKKGPDGLGERLKKSNLRQAWLVLLLSIVFGAALSGVQAKLGPTIAQNSLNEMLQRVPELVWGERANDLMTRKDAPAVITSQVVRVQTNGKTKYYKLFKAMSGGRLDGWVVKTSGRGYADRIDMLVGIDPSATIITGLYILEQKETPGLGNKILSSRWRSQFADRKTDQPLVVTKGGDGGPHAIDAITGATISSRSVTRIVNRAVRDLKPELAAAYLEGNDP